MIEGELKRIFDELKKREHLISKREEELRIIESQILTRDEESSKREMALIKNEQETWARLIKAYGGMMDEEKSTPSGGEWDIEKEINAHRELRKTILEEKKNIEDLLGKKKRG